MPYLTRAVNRFSEDPIMFFQQADNYIFLSRVNNICQK